MTLRAQGRAPGLARESRRGGEGTRPAVTHRAVSGDQGDRAALSNFERARRCYEKAGLVADWHRVVSSVRSEHHRKTGFIPGFEQVVTGSGPSEKPSFLERAKARWGSRRSEDGQ